LEKSEVARLQGRAGNEAKYTEFASLCEEGNVSACNSLGEWYAMMRSDFGRAAGLYTTACLRDGYPNACYNLGIALGEAGQYAEALDHLQHVAAAEPERAEVFSSIGADPHPALGPSTSGDVLPTGEGTAR